MISYVCKSLKNVFPPFCTRAKTLWGLFDFFARVQKDQWANVACNSLPSAVSTFI